MERDLDAPAGATRRQALTMGCALPFAAAIGAQAAAAGAATPGPARGPARVSIRPTPPPPQRPARRAQLAVPGATIDYWDTGGRGAPVILLHPGTGNGDSFVYQQPVLVDAGYRVVGYSRRGFAGSVVSDAAASPPGEDDLHALVEHLGAPRVHLVGCSAGGMLAAAYATAHPDRIASLIFAGSVINTREPVMAAAQKVLIPKEFYSLPSEFRELGPSYRAVDPDGVARWKALDDAPKTRGMTLVRTQQDVRFEVLARTAPTLLVTGDADLYCPPAVLEQVHARMPGSEMTILDDCGHACFWEQPAAFNRQLLDFLGRHRTGPMRKTAA